MVEAQRPTRAYLDVTRASDGRYCVAFVRGGFNRRSYTPSAEQIIVQAQRAGSIAVRTDDADLRQCCREAGVALLETGVEG
jgi:hypothetical protein